MRVLGRVLLAVGFASLAAAGLKVYDIIRLATAYDLVAEAPLTLGEKTATETLTVSTEKACRLGVRVELTTESIAVEEDAEGETEYEPRYRFPVAYTVLDASGEAVHSEHTAVDWDGGTRSTSSSRVTASSAKLTVESYFDKFDVGPPGEIVVEVTVEPDTDFGAKASSVQLRVYDNVERIPAGLVVGAVAFGVAGLALMGVGGYMATRPGAAGPNDHHGGTETQRTTENDRQLG